MTHRPDGLVLFGAGRMGLALLSGWVTGGLAGRGTVVVEPSPTPDLLALCKAQGFVLNPASADSAAQCLVVAVKPQMLDDAAAAMAPYIGAQTLVVSILAGKSIADLAARLPAAKAIVRAMPNTPAAIGRGISGLVASAATTQAQRGTAETLLAAVGATVWLSDEAQMDAVTAVSGSGPAYVFLLAEVLADAGRAAGLPADLAVTLARRTVEGAAALMEAEAATAPAKLRENVTSPGGTTAAALSVLMAADGLSPLMRRAVDAAVRRGRDLAG